MDGIVFSIFLLIFEWVLQKCNINLHCAVLPVIYCIRVWLSVCIAYTCASAVRVCVYVCEIW